jgi:NAD(P)-dependent dehydrogenase (short-subunit alcohol dehydrogenase family)
MSEIAACVQVNHLGHWVIASRLAAQRLQGSSAKPVKPLHIVLVTSCTHQRGRIRYADLQAEKKYVPFDSYAQSKLAMTMTAVEISKRAAAWQQNRGFPNSVVTCTSVHPGLVNTPLARHYFQNDYFPRWIRPVAWPIVKPLLQVLLIPPERSVNTMVHAAFGDKQAINGQFVDVNGVSRMPPLAEDSTARGKLWQISCELARIADPLKDTRH